MPAETIQMTFREQLRELLDEKGWSIVDLARESSIPYSTCKSYFLNDKKRRLPTYGHAVLICTALGKSLDVFKNCEDFQKP